MRARPRPSGQLFGVHDSEDEIADGVRTERSWSGENVVDNRFTNQPAVAGAEDAAKARRAAAAARARKLAIRWRTRRAEP